MRTCSAKLSAGPMNIDIVPDPARALAVVGDSHVHADSFARKAARRLGWDLVGEGVPGAGIDGALIQAGALPPALTVILSVGTNELGNAPWDGVERMGDRYSEILACLKGRRVFCVTIIPFQNMHEDHVVRSMNWIIRREAARAESEVFDAYDHLMSSSGRVHAPVDYRDTLHMSDRGNEYLSSLLAYQIKTS